MHKLTHHLVSVSGGKDSSATLLLAMKQFPDQVEAVFADTGNEHETTYEYLDYLEAQLGLKITRLRADFAERMLGKRRWIEAHWAEDGVPEERIKLALEMLVPTGVPFLDLCLWKGRFPSRKAQFCTSELKTIPLTEYAMGYTDVAGFDVWSWQGVRRDESPARANALGFEEVGGGLYINRPIAGWTAQETVDFVRRCGLKLNPLYEQGMSRVGCMPCINVRKDELAEIARRFPDHIAKIAAWEKLAAETSKHGTVSFIAAVTGGRGDRQGHTIEAVVRWAKTKRGGVEHNPAWDEEAPACSSSYGLCE